MKNIVLICSLTILAVIHFLGCSASTGNRYESDSAKEEEKNEESIVEEEFDFSSRKIEFDLPDVRIPSNFETVDAWYGYENLQLKEPKITGTTNGYRVQVLTTDNLEEAENMRIEILFSTTSKQVYITFEPPFYKVKVGDFISKYDAENFSFKLNQLGYQDVRVVNELVNIFE